MANFPKIHLVAFDQALYYEWKSVFDGCSDVEVHDADILTLEGDAIVSPANSFGYMDGGLDLKYSQHFGWEVEERLREVLVRDHFGEIPVGQALVIRLPDANFRFLVSAPTMRVPMDVSNTANAYLAFKAVLIAVRDHNSVSESPISTVFCPGLGTGEGRMPPKLCARQMYEAYRVCVHGEVLKKGGLGEAVSQHMRLTGYQS